VSGPQTSPGYWLAPQKTAERFVDLPVSSCERRRFYRTGDRVKCCANGEYAFLGRADFQVKVLGYRVELGEIEAVLRRDAGISEAVALGWPVADGVAQGVVAFVMGNNVDEKHLISEASRTLPHYMVPQRLVIVDEMPKNANGKVDRNALQRRLADEAGMKQGSLSAAGT
jgi:acyl-coenzyme A synthetase/AMP-(fatty) acid ligase